MFTGLIEATGRVATVDSGDGAAPGKRLRIATPLGAELRPGDSIAVDGVCLTVTTADAGGFSATVSPETLRVTTLAHSAEGGVVNLERPLQAGARLGGHFVLGHVDAVGRIARFTRDGECHWLDIDLPPHLAPLAIPKGSIAVNGISLTVASLAGERVGIQIVPFTFEHTSLHAARAGDFVNLEMDMIGKYIARLLEARAEVVQ
jgi:riboflavin synthase